MSSKNPEVDRTTAVELSDDNMTTESKNDLQDSDMTSHTNGESLCEEEPGSWLGAIGGDFRNIASCFKDNIPPVIGGVANLVHQTAMSVAAEIAQLERDGELEAERWKTDSGASLSEANSASLPLPWETRQEASHGGPTVYAIDDDLRKTIFGLSLCEDTFRKPFLPAAADSPAVERSASFEFTDQKIELIRRLLDIDENLAAMHARLSGRSSVKENAFWRNYFYHCEKTRKEHIKRCFRQKSGKVADSDRAHAEPGHCDSTGVFVSHFPSSSSRTDAIVDDSSLVPASVTDDSSYVNIIASPPNSFNTFMTTRSLEDLVLVDREGKDHS